MFEVQHIALSWDHKPLLEDVSFSVAPGDVVMIAGANGAGKTTLMRILAGLVRPSSGVVRADGLDVFARPLRYRQLLGYLPERVALEPDMTVRGYLKFRARLRGEMFKKIRYRVQEAINLCGLLSVADTRLDVLSHGFRRRVALADALLLRPRYLLLDDLMAGLDPATRASFGSFLKAVSAFAAVVVTGHELDDMARWATQFLVLTSGLAVNAPTAMAVKKLLGLEVTP